MISARRGGGGHLRDWKAIKVYVSLLGADEATGRVAGCCLAASVAAAATAANLKASKERK